MKKMILATLIGIGVTTKAEEITPQVLLYEPSILLTNSERTSADLKGIKPKAVDLPIFERTLKSAIQTLENSMRKTCAREMETSISVTAEGQWVVVGVSITGAIKLNLLNPEMAKNCAKK